MTVSYTHLDVYKRQRKYVRGMKVQGLAQSQHGAEVLIGDGQVMPGDDTVLQVFGVYSLSLIHIFGIKNKLSTFVCYPIKNNSL